MSRVFVESEFAPLRRVVVARCEMRLPDPDFASAELLQAEAAILPEAERAIALQLLGRDHAEAMLDRQRAWEAEREALARELGEAGVEVLRPDLLTAAQKAAGGQAGWANAFVRDPWFTVGDTVIEGSLRFPHRRLEVLPSRALMRREVVPSTARYVAVPQPDIVPLDEDSDRAGPFLEGGDVLVLGRHVFVGQSGRASSATGVAFLAKLLAPLGYTVEAVRLKPTVLHLDCALGLVRDGLMVVCPSLFLDGVPARLAGWDRIEVSEAEAMTLATNGLPVSPDLYITDPAFRRIGEAVARRGVRVAYVDFAISRAFGGAFRCSTQALLRE